MIYFTDHDIDRLIEDDVPAGDMTSLLLGLHGQQGRIEIFARNRMVVCCTEEAVRMYQKVGLKVLFAVASGTMLEIGDKILEAEGDAQSLHLIWRTGGAMIEFASGIAERTHLLAKLARSENPSVSVAGTRKHPPYLKKIALKALMAGGGVPHRTGLSDSILLFREHLLFTGGYGQLPALIQRIRLQQKERMVVVEAHSQQEALAAAVAGADAVQLDKLSPVDFERTLVVCREENPGICMIAAGGINASNIAAYAKAGADVLVSSWMYFAPPADIQVKINNLE
ncbi:ModD protein [Mangrovibacterium diazotrophicum]|uniref:Putative pyrophosphorylase ModD n=1 Tax=Mangrovibacterium diazotrophicum TaxID=1261403 RepID=A0A419W4L0_9BACT|nr:ModD protein [Mangrovibacterium diazotrophicum]RKD90394.1 molybdenum transport protein [Mangrovibacterium diazotrophicum]